MFLSILCVDYLQNRLDKLPYVSATSTTVVLNSNYFITTKKIAQNFFVGDKCYIGTSEKEYLEDDDNSVIIRKIARIEEHSATHNKIWFDGSILSTTAGKRLYNLGVDIEIGSFQKFINEEQQNEIAILNSYRFEQEDFIPAMAYDFVGEYIPITDITSIDIDIPLGFIVKIDLLQRALLKLNYFSKSLVGHIDILNPIDDGVNPTYTVVSNGALVQPNSDPFYLNGVNVIELGLGIPLNVSSDVYFGNEVEYYLADTKIEILGNPEELPKLTVLSSSYAEVENEILLGTVNAFTLRITSVDNGGTNLFTGEKLSSIGNIIELNIQSTPNYNLTATIEGVVRTLTFSSLHQRYTANFTVNLGGGLLHIYTVIFSLSPYVASKATINVPNYQRIIPINRNQDRASVPETYQLLGQRTAKTIIKDNVWNCEMALHYKKFTEENIYDRLMYQIEGKDNYYQNKEWYLKIKYPKMTFEKVVVVDSCAISPEINAPIIMDFVFKEKVDV